MHLLHAVGFTEPPDCILDTLGLCAVDQKLLPDIDGAGEHLLRRDIPGPVCSHIEVFPHVPFRC